MGKQPFLQRLGRHSARHRAAYVATWAVLVVAGFVTSLGLLGGQSLFDRLETGDIVAPGQATQVRDLVTENDDGALPVMLRVDGVDFTDPELTLAVRHAVSRLERIDGVGKVSSPMTHPGWPRAPEAWALVGDNDPASGRFLIVVEAGSELDSDVQQEVVRELRGSSSYFIAPYAEDLQVGGTGLLVDDIVQQIKDDLKVGEGIAIPLSLLLMVVVFGGFVAAGMPIVGAIASISGALAMLLGFSHVMTLDATVVNIVTVMGLALCIDYGLLLVSRFREELARVAPGVASSELTRTQVEEAVGGAVATAGRTVLFSAVIVGISLSGLMLFEAPVMRAIGAAGVCVVAVALLVALTLVPALCSLGARRLGNRRGAEAAPDEGVFSQLARLTQRRPALTTLASVAVLLALALPALDLRLNASGVEMLPAKAEQRTFFEGLERDFPLFAPPTVTVVAEADEDEARRWADELAENELVTQVHPPRALGEGTGLVVVDLFTEGGSMGDDARTVAAELRQADPGFPTWTGGQAASLADFTDSVKERAPWAVAWIAGATFLLLFLLTGSVVIPVKALLLNVVSLGASIGVLVWVFQYGNLEGLLRFDSVGGIESVIPLLVLAFGFGLSMDYEVFLLARIIELHEQGFDDDTAVRLGLQRSGRIITSAALIMVIVFAGFAVGQMLVIKQTGVALAVAVFIDATLVRMVIVPATMTMLGRWNWWAPRWMKRIHARFGVSEHTSPIAPKSAPANV
ncbi:MMPL family transporter [Nocardioides daphniae]|uniref:MMPL family transporter n=1 Tax=Nocardioides daphniae TaxID=402297 RepID=A0A4P7UCU4_9ACTN|nr:MMPL family transporter [Nocardioides daphniae]QCC78062.1 MMPL family transporter [Nocardioides daphniae]GGD22555.1 membrane protein [Nocardioides daphniae]